MKQIYRAFLAAAMIALLPAALLPATAQDEEKPHWFGGSYDNETVLVYGIPDSDYVALSFSCEQGKSTVNVNVQGEESSAEDGTLLLVRLAAGGEKIEFSDRASLNQDSGGVELKGHLPLNEAVRHILTSKGTLEIFVDGHMQRYEMAGAVEPAAKLIAACDFSNPAADLEVKMTNKTSRLLESFTYSEAGMSEFNGDTFGSGTLVPGASWTFTIPNGRNICTFDMAVNFVEEECCSDPLPVGTQNLCENSEFLVHDH